MLLLLGLLVLRAWLPEYIIKSVLEDSKELTQAEYWQANKILSESRHLREHFKRAMEDSKLTKAEYQEILRVDARMKLERTIGDT